MDDAAVVAVQIGRPLRSGADVVARCHLGLPVVTRVPPILDDGTPFPTLFWLTCPLAVKRIGRLEATGAVGALEGEMDAALGAALEAASERYAAAREELVPPGATRVPAGGVGGTRNGIKCLHAHYADHGAGNANPIGLLTAPWVEPLNCAVGCVAEGSSGPRRNPEWSEPR